MSAVVPRFLAALVIASVAALMLAPVQAATHTVRPDGTGDYPTIQAAVDSAFAGDVIELTDGTFTGPGNRDLDYGGKANTIRSASADAGACIIDCEGSETDPHLGFRFHSHEGTGSVLEGVTVSNGWGVASAIWCRSNSGPELRNCTFRDGTGPALLCDNSDLHVDGCRFLDNNGGAIRGPYAAGFVQESVLEGNVAAEEGGGLYLTWGSVTVIRCRFTRNTAPHGGAIYSTTSYLEFYECIMDGNAAVQGGAAYIDYNRSTSFRHCTMVANSADEGGSALAGNASLTYCIMCYSPRGVPIVCFPSSPSGGCWDVFGNADGDYVGCISGANHGTNISVDPEFCATVPGDYYLRETSPCAEENNPDCGQIGALAVNCYDPTSGVPAPGTPPRNEVTVIGPNPFTSRVEIRAGRSAVLVITPTGRVIRRLDPSPTIVWDGRDDGGRPAAAGVYLVRRVGGGSEAPRIVLVR
jgi:predicted outer membrane repeat protein